MNAKRRHRRARRAERAFRRWFNGCANSTALGVTLSIAHRVRGPAVSTARYIDVLRGVFKSCRGLL